MPERPEGLLGFPYERDGRPAVLFHRAQSGEDPSLTKCPAPHEVGLTARSGSRHRFGPQSTSDLPLVPQGRYV